MSDLEVSLCPDPLLQLLYSRLTFVCLLVRLDDNVTREETYQQTPVFSVTSGLVLPWNNVHITCMINRLMVAGGEGRVRIGRDCKGSRSRQEKYKYHMIGYWFQLQSMDSSEILLNFIIATWNLYSYSIVNPGRDYSLSDFQELISTTTTAIDIKKRTGIFEEKGLHVRN
ncbi:hypothetical protein SNE40_000075 [Patella caerulea]|uniref:Uncharacterized protein n=1 Tax=Patella caerulea TaxID=87958 RepID=A0AAN8Q160_PATCE